jgi:hypothetical protein
LMVTAYMLEKAAVWPGTSTLQQSTITLLTGLQ